MALDNYSPCPGGSGKRLKFCCKDLISDLEKIDRMIDGQQHEAALQHLERLLQQHPDRACLMALRAEVLRLLDRRDQLAVAVQQFNQKHPESPVALAEKALLAAEDGKARPAMEHLQRAIRRCKEAIDPRVYDAASGVAAALLHDGQILAGRALLMLQTVLDPEDPRPMDVAMQINASPTIPTLVKDDPAMTPCPAGVAWQPQFDDAMAAVGRAHWLEAADRFAALAQKVPDEPAVWRNLAIVRGWLADSAGAAEAWRKLSRLLGDSEDAVEAEALAVLMSEEQLGDGDDLLHAVFNVSDLELVQVGLAGSRQAGAVPVNPSAAQPDGSPPPKASYVLFDKLTADDNTDPAAAPRMIAQALLFGKQTDRDARVEMIGVQRGNLALARSVIDAAAPGALAGEPTLTVLGKESRTRALLRPDWRMPRNMEMNNVGEFINGLYRRALIDEWTQLPLGLLGGKTAREAVGQPEYRIRLRAAVLVVESWAQQRPFGFDFNRLRAELGLPEAGPLAPADVNIDQLPLVRLPRLEVAGLSDDALALVYRKAVAFRVPGAMEKFANELVNRPSMAATEEVRSAYRIMAEEEQDPRRALEFIQRGRAAAEAAGQSSAPWDMIELRHALQMGNVADAQRLVVHLQREHMREPGVAEALTQLFVQLGLMRPDGSPVVPQQAAAQAATTESGLVVPGSAAGSEPGKIWTPDAGGGAGGGKIILPD